MHLTSLPGKFGIGDLGPQAHRFIDLLAEARQSWWQILPLGPPGAGGSPYQCYSAFAGNPDLLSPQVMLRDGLLSRGDIAGKSFSAGRADLEEASRFKSTLLAAAWDRFQADTRHALHGEFATFRETESAWLDDFALFMALREAHNGDEWNRWPRDVRIRKTSALRDARRALGGAIDRHRFRQFLFFRQLDLLRAHARERGVQLIGDLPIFVSGDSADVWANPQLFLLDRDLRPTFVAGVPPDYFSKTGQRWGNPLYNWRAMERSGFDWWVRRVRSVLRQVDLVRIDHFRGFAACWTIPAANPTAEKGRWVEAPGRALFQVVREKLGRLPFIAEDLGLITPDVEALRDELGLPGMRVLQFAFGGGANNPFLPHNYPQNAVTYTGTQDNDTTAGWYVALKAGERKQLHQYAPDAKRNAAHALIRLAWSSVADLAIAPVQDVLGMGSDARMNTPGTASGNWRWRLTALPDARAMDRLGAWTETYGRAAPLTPE